MTAGQRLAVARVAAPLAFLLLATIAVVLVRAALDEPASTPAPTVGTTTREPAATTQRRPGRTTATTPAAYYRVQEGDTLESIAAANGTSVEELLTLNPGVDPVALRIGQRIRVG